MIIGVPKEIKPSEYRVGITPSTASRLIEENHTVLVQKNSGEGIGATDDDYVKVGVKVVDGPEEIFKNSNMIVKVKEPQESEWKMLKEEQILFTYLHLAADPKQAKGLIDAKCHAIAYETITDNKGALPLLAPMSEIAGRLAVFEGAYHLKKNLWRTWLFNICCSRCKTCEGDYFRGWYGWNKCSSDGNWSGGRCYNLR